ncbi:MAG: hypothetical protein N3G19_03215, partial [Candidatus Pacearchaeota archaeon]|nr:hypothetical protein [Candidatus Pacearchaeota archaeon]
TNTQEIKNIIVSLNKPAYLNSVYGLLAQATHKAELTGTQMKVYDLDDTTVLFQRNYTEDQNIKPIKAID